MDKLTILSFNDQRKTTSNNSIYAKKERALSFIHIEICGVEQLIDQQKIHSQCLSKDPKERKEALDQLSSFSLLPDKQQAWNDLILLANDQDFYVRFRAASTLIIESSQMPDKQKAWNDLIELISSDQDNEVKPKAAYALHAAFSQVPDEQKAWNDLHKLTNHQDSLVRSEAASVLGSVFSQLSDKLQAREDLHRLTNDQDSLVRSEAAYALGPVYSQLSDKLQAWEDLHRLTNDLDKNVRSSAASALYYVFPHVPDIQQAWNDLHRLINDQESRVRSSAAEALGYAISQVPDKQQAWNDLIKLTNDEDSCVRSEATLYLDSVFSEVTDKQQAWNDLHRLTYDKDSNVRHNAAIAIGFVFSEVPDKQQAWNDLHKLAYDEDCRVRYNTVTALDFVFSKVPYKYQVLKDLFKLTKDQDCRVRINANHSLGKISIIDASQTEGEEDYKRELENAIEFFEKSSQESRILSDGWGGSCKFCLPFYRSFYTMLFKGQEAQGEVDKYLAEAKKAIKGSKSKELLFEAVETLANTLKEIKNRETLDSDVKESELSFHRQYSERLAEIMMDAEKEAPFATMTIRKGLPFLDKDLKWIIEEIQEKAKIACKESRGAATEEIARAVNREVQRWEIGSQEDMNWYVDQLIFTLESNTPKAPENQTIFDKIEQIREEKNLVKQYAILCGIIPMIPNLHIKQEISELTKEVCQIKKTVDTLTISLKLGIKQEIEISSGIEILGTGAKLITIIPLQEISYVELKEDLKRINGKRITKLSELPDRLARKIKRYLLLKEREDIIEQLL